MLKLAMLGAVLVTAPGLANDAGDVEQVLAETQGAIMALPNVVGVGLGKCGDDYCVRVMASECNPLLKERLEALLGETPYAIELTDPVRSLPGE